MPAFKIYSMQFKLKAIRSAIQKRKRPTAEQLDVKENQTRELRKCETEIEDTVQGIKNGGKKTTIARKSKTF